MSKCPTRAQQGFDAVRLFWKGHKAPKKHSLEEQFTTSKSCTIYKENIWESVRYFPIFQSYIVSSAPLYNLLPTVPAGNSHCSLKFILENHCDKMQNSFFVLTSFLLLSQILNTHMHKIKDNFSQKKYFVFPFWILAFLYSMRNGTGLTYRHLCNFTKNWEIK